jgi:hypothetical protein
MTCVTERDWYAWHHDYDNPATGLAGRLAAVQEQVRDALEAARPGPLRAISMCAGQGRDLIGALAGHPRQHDVRARLVELDPRNADAARQAARAAGLPQVEVVTADAALTDAYAGMVPADLVLACGVFGNVTDADIERTVGYCTQLCARGGTVIWTRGRWAPDLLPRICDWFAGCGFDQLWVSDPAEDFGAATHRFTGTPDPLEPGARMFTFRDHHPRTASPRPRSLSTERTVVPAPPPVPGAPAPTCEARVSRAPNVSTRRMRRACPRPHPRDRNAARRPGRLSLAHQYDQDPHVPGGSGSMGGSGGLSCTFSSRKPGSSRVFRSRPHHDALQLPAGTSVTRQADRCTADPPDPARPRTGT